VPALREAETAAGIEGHALYEGFGARVERCRDSLRRFLAGLRSEGRSVAGYGAAAKGNTLLNYCGITTAEIPYVVDRSPHKQGRYLPGSRIPIMDPLVITETRPDYLLILPWNLTDEIVGQMAHIRAWNGRFVVAIPTTRVLA
jgi:hypothetical protein